MKFILGGRLRWVEFGFLIACLVVFTACSNKAGEKAPLESSGDAKGTAPPAAVAKRADQALVRFVNGTSASKDLGFGQAVPFDGVESTGITAYKELPAERNEFKLSNNGDRSNLLVSNSEGLSAGKHDTVLAVAEKDGKTTLDPVLDNLVSPSPGMVKVQGRQYGIRL